MKTVSNTYATSMKSSMRNPSHLKITLDNVAITSNDSVQTITYTRNNIINPYKGGNLLSPHDTDLTKWYAGDMNGNVIGDGVRFNYGNGITLGQGLVSEYMSGAEGATEVNGGIALLFSPPIPSLESITVNADINSSEYNENLLYSFFVRDTDDVEYSVIDSPSNVCHFGKTIQNVDVINISVNYQNVAPYTRIRVENIITGEVLSFTDDNISGASWTDEVDPLARRLPTHSLAWSVLDYEGIYDPMNVNGKYDFINTNREVRLQYGYSLDDVTIEWLSPETYFLESKPDWHSGIATFIANKMNARCNDMNYYDVQNTQFANKIPTIANMSGVKTSFDRSSDSTLAKTSNYLPFDTVANTYQMIANATGNAIWFRDGFANIKPFPYNQTNFTISQDDIVRGTDKITVNNRVKDLIVNGVNYAIASDYTELANNVDNTFSANEEGIIEYGGMYYDVQFTGVAPTASTGDSNNNRSARRFTVNYNYSPSNVWTLRGKSMTRKTTGKLYKVNTEGDDVTLNNELITFANADSSVFNSVFTGIWIPYLNKRNVLEFDYRGNPELDVGDIFTYEDRYGNIRNVVVLRNTINYNGAIRGHLIVKEL